MLVSVLTTRARKNALWLSRIAKACGATDAVVHPRMCSLLARQNADLSEIILMDRDGRFTPTETKRICRMAPSIMFEWTDSTVLPKPLDFSCEHLLTSGYLLADKSNPESTLLLRHVLGNLCRSTEEQSIGTCLLGWASLQTEEQLEQYPSSPGVLPHFDLFWQSLKRSLLDQGLSYQQRWLGYDGATYIRTERYTGSQAIPAPGRGLIPRIDQRPCAVAISTSIQGTIDVTTITSLRSRPPNDLETNRMPLAILGPELPMHKGHDLTQLKKAG